MSFETVIGLEIHTQLATQSKIFCSCSTEFGQPPNANTCPVCLGLPGVLPVLNEKAIELAIRIGLATHCHIRKDSQFARKNYFYPDLPKAYQISQFDRPICERGWIDIEVDGTTKRVGITRIHMEEDAGKLVHDEQGESSFVDLNRAGIPLVEIVSEPDMRSPQEAKAYMEKMHSLVTYLGVSEGSMEKGHFRCDANVSLRPKGQKEFGTRTETKNLNSFKFIQQAITYEIGRQTDIILDGGTIVQETRLWDTEKKMTYSMRSKEEADDYRYFPEPDLPVILIADAQIETIKKNLPELPEAKRTRFQEVYGLSDYDSNVLAAHKEVADYFEEVVTLGSDPKSTCHWITMELMRVMNETHQSIRDIQVSPAYLAELIALQSNQTISQKIAKQVFDTMRESQISPQVIVEEEGLGQVSDQGALDQVVEKIIANNPNQVEQYRGGKTKLLSFFMGQVMKETQGQANPEVVNRLLRDKL